MKNHSDYTRILTVLVGGDTMRKIKKGSFEILEISII